MELSRHGMDSLKMKTYIKELTRRSRAIVKKDMRENAIAIQKIKAYDRMTEKGITEETFDDAKRKANQLDNAYKIMDMAWKGLREAVDVIANPRLDEYNMSAEEKETVRNAIDENPRGRMAQTSFLLRAAKVIRNIDPRTETEVWEIGAETGVEYLKDLGLDVVEGVTKDIEDVAATTACRGPSRDTR